MNKVVITAVVVLGLAIGAQTFAYEYVGGYRTIATETQVVIGGEVFDVKVNPKTEVEKAHKISWLKAQIDTLSAQMAVADKEVCAK